ncbi:murein hydrolase activator EnvC family protein [Pseudooceanicola onchidii]|uniref:murein hydrolase activator EnvC family protein n=1 Tax=Pseudooceanicola onchidii TaxID=2562279 RepID=UPI0010AB4382|nr:peptidoglycan DD-metalloendopeptidase family protein [Pseudooceanicola onchidii]
MTRTARLLALIAALVLALALPGGLRAQSDTAAAATAAMQAIERATAMLDAADEAPDRVAALTETTRAFEDGLAAMREGLRQVSAREAVLAADLASRDGEIAQLLGTLEVMGGTGTPVVFLHPSGAVGTARSAMIVADVSRALDARAAQLRGQLNEVRVLRQLQESAARTLADGLRGVQEARTDLSQAIADRTDLPRKFTEDPIKTALLIASTETLSAFASGLADITDSERDLDLPPVTARKGDLPLPVQGRVLRRAGEADAAGITRAGVVLATRPRALVTSPTAATIRYRGPLLDLGNVIILEPETGILFVFAGLDVVYGASGDIVAAGAPLGLMGGDDPDLDALLTADGSTEGSGNGRSETLYMEVRQDNTPQDPAAWFRGIEE